jgi:hypothetical protein
MFKSLKARIQPQWQQGGAKEEQPEPPAAAQQPAPADPGSPAPLDEITPEEAARFEAATREDLIAWLKKSTVNVKTKNKIKNNGWRKNGGK